MSNEPNTPEAQEQPQQQINLGGPFHPVVIQVAPGEHQQFTGATMRDFFASQAPAEVPDWFQTSDQLELPDLPAMLSPLKALEASPAFSKIKDDRKAMELAHHYVREGYVPEDDAKLSGIVAFAVDMMESSKAAIKEVQSVRSQVVKENLARRYFAWRWHYADQVLRARGF